MLNSFYDDTKESPWGVAFRDMMTATVGLLLILLVIMKTDVAKKSEDNITKIIPGSVTVFIEWPKNLDVDVDLWVKNEKEVNGIGYSNKAGNTMDLLRDDLGHTSDNSVFNMEMLTSRGVIPGEWIVNIHYYSDKTPAGPKQTSATKIPVKIAISVYKPPQGEQSSMTVIYEGEVLLEYPSQEKTVYRFEFDKDGEIVPASQNSIFKSIRGVTGWEGR